MKTKLKTSARIFKSILFTKNLTNSELTAYKSLIRNESITICKPDKGHGVVVLNSSDYHQKINDIISDTSKFVELPEEMNIFIISRPKVLWLSLLMRK